MEILQGLRSGGVVLGNPCNWAESNITGETKDWRQSKVELQSHHISRREILDTNTFVNILHCSILSPILSPDFMVDKPQQQSWA